MAASSLHKLFSLIVLLFLVMQPFSVAGKQVDQETSRQGVGAPAAPPPSGLFRTTVTVDSPARRARLATLGVAILSEGAGVSTVLATAEQLETLARLRFEPRASDDADALIAHHAASQPALAVAWGELRQRIETDAKAGSKRMGVAAASLSAYPLASVAALTSIDDDGDGLTNTEEAWWCTGSLNPDTDADGRSDGAEIQALKDWMANKRAGSPGETPWPNWPFNATTCPDKDHDSIPNLAERWELGLNMDLESSDRDKFDDGQELFGVTYCPGGDLSCGYGDLPRSSDSGYVGAAMPAWVKAPGNHPLVAGFPVPEVDVVESSLRVQTVTTVTTDHTIASGTEKSYSTAKTEGTSSSIADTVMWNDWQETSRTVPDSQASSREVDPLFNGLRPMATQGNYFGLKVTGATLGLAGAVGGAFCVVTAGIGCAVLAGAGIVGAGIALTAELLDQMDDLQNQAKANRCDPDAPYVLPKCIEKFVPATSETGQAVDEQPQTVSTQDLAKGGAGTQYSTGSSGLIQVQPKIQISYPSQRPTTTTTTGHSDGGSHTTTHAQYEEHTVTNGEAFSSDESWGNATAVDSAHTADLWFTYKVRNAGTEYAREIANLAFNIYIGDDPNPAYTYFVGPDLGGDGKFHNFMPVEEHTYAARHIPLTLEQMKAIDLSGPVRIVVEDFTYGTDELFYQDAANAGVLLAIEDGTADSDEAIDSYLIPTWGDETVLDVLGRYFPHTTDAGGMMVAIWTPEYRADTPAWCAEPKVVGTGSQRTLWCKHALSTADWWNVYTNGMGDGSEGFQDTPASPGSVALFRFNQDSDLDGYSDRSELRLGTDPNDPASFPKPELIAGVHSARNGNNVVATLSLLNTGVYDAYGVEAVLIAPNDTISITNNTVGGSGRVRAQKQVIVGSRIALQTPLPAAWLAAGHAKPAAGGYYTGAADRTYTFTAADSGSVGAGTLRLGWSDGAGGSGTLDFGAGYLSPTPRDVSNGVKLGLLSGTLAAGESFTLAATTPRDTFQYTIAAGHENDFTPPIVLVSYNDPQGNHRFGIPPAAMSLGLPTDNLMAFSGQMLQEPGVEIVTTAAATAGANTTNLMVNNPTGTALTNARLFLEFVNISGTVVSEVPTMTNLPPGPNVVPVSWDTATFSPAYDSAQDYIVMAFLTDYQGNILDTAARPLSSFQEDPKPIFAMADTDATWDFGTAAQGTLLKRSFTFANTGSLDLLTYISAPAGLTVSQTGSRRVSLADMTTYEMALNTANLTVGPYDGTITIRTSDPDARERTVHVTGMIATPTEPALAYNVDPYRPWEQTVFFPAAHNANETLEFSHRITTDASKITPLYYLDQNRQVLGHGRDIAEWAGTNWSEKAQNAGFESGNIGSWTAASGIWTVVGSQAHNGSYSVQPTQPGNSNPVLYQDINLSTWRNWIDQNFGGLAVASWLKPGNQKGRMQVVYLRADGSEITRNDSGWIGSNGNWQPYNISRQIPVGTDRVRLLLEAEPATGDTGWIELLGPFTNNGGFETGDMSGWTMGAGAARVNTTYHRSGSYSVFQTYNANPAWFFRDIAIPSQYRQWIDAGYGTADFGGWFGVWSEENLEFIWRFYQGSTVLYTYDTGWIPGGKPLWTYFGSQSPLPPGTDRVRVEIWQRRSRSDNNDVPTDDITLRVRFAGFPVESDITFDDASCVLYPFYDVENLPTNNAVTRLSLPRLVEAQDRQLMQYGLRQTYTSAGAATYYVRLPYGSYTDATLQALLRDTTADRNGIQISFDVGADGSNEWQAIGFPEFPAPLTTGNLASALTVFVLSQAPDAEGMVEVPIRVSLSTGGVLFLANLAAVPTAGADASIGDGDVTFGGGIVAAAVHESATNTRIAPADHSRIRAVFVDGTNPTEGDTITIHATIHNGGTLDTGPLTAAFYATPAGGTAWYIGSAFVPSVPPSSPSSVSIPWHTLGFTGPVTITVMADPYNRVAELSETNNVATATVTIQTRPDLSIPAIALSDAEPVTGRPVTVTVTMRNAGQTAAAAQTTTLYNGNPDAGGTLLGNRSVTSIAGGGTRTATFTWTPAKPGAYRLFSRTDRTGVVGESDEGNNDAWRDVYVGFGAPIALDSGSIAADPVYTGTLGYGAVDTGLRDERVACPGHTDSTLRRDPNNRVGYRFDHLQPGRFYHLDVILYECDRLSRIQRVLVDDMLVGGPVSLGDQAEHRLSLRLDPALYRDHVIQVAVIGEDGSQRGAVVASVSLREIDYRYADSGAANDPVYTGARGWGYLTEDNSVAIAGPLPYRSARVNQGGPELRYRFDRLDPAKRYQVALTFWQATGNPLLQRVRVDGLDTPATVNLVAGTVTTATVRLSPAAYATDGSVVVSVVVLNAGAGATVNEISLEEETLLTESPCRVRPSASLSLALGGVTVNGLAAPNGTVVTAENPRGDIVGCYVVGTDGSPAGQYGFMAIYGEDASASPPIPGMRDGELVAFRVDGALAQAIPLFYWHNDTTEHWTDLVAVPLSGQSILLPQTWNFLSFRVAPPVPLLEAVLGSIAGKYDRVLGEEGFWSTDIPPQFRTLTELHAGRSYYLRLTVPSANLLIEGSSLAVTTPLPLHPQWNWVGYLPQTTLPVTVALGSIAGRYQRVLGTAGQFYDIRYPTFSTLKQMAPGQGYRIYATQAATLTYPATAVVAAPPSAETPVKQAGACGVTATPNMTFLFGGLTINDRPAPTGTLVEALTPRGAVAGCFTVETPGQYGFMALYGEDPTAAPPIPGFRADEPIRLRVNGLKVEPGAAIAWQDDLTPHRMDLVAKPYRHWLPLIAR